MTATAETTQGGRAHKRLLRRRAGRASIVLGLTVLFGSGMTGQAFSEPGNANGEDHERPAKVTICHATGAPTNPYREITISVNGLHGHEGHEGDIIPAPEGGCPGPEGEGERERITICHATRSETNPYREITISVNGLHGHEGHEGDIIPAPEGGCPGPEGEGERDRITICHATGSETNPYELITIDVNGLHGHEGHEGDIIPAPEGGCPVPETTTTTVPETTTTTVPETTTTTVPETTTTTVAETTTTTVPETTSTTVAETTTTTVAETTTTTVPETTTTVPETTTTVADTTTTTVAAATVTTVAGTTTTGSDTTTQPAVLGLTLEGGGNLGTTASGGSTTVLGAHFERGGDTLARTGSSLTPLATFGLGLLMLGALLKLSARPTPATAATAGKQH